VPPVKILIVEDFEPFRKLIFLILKERLEFQVVGEASDGLLALQKVQQLQPDLILLDVGLPNLNGIGVARRLRKVAVPPKILFLAQESSPDVVGEALRLGALGYVHKARTVSDLLPAVDAVLRGERFVSSGLLEFSEGTNAPGRHEVQFYSADSVFLENSIRFIASALKTGDPAIVVATKPRRDGVDQRLKEEGFDVDGLIQQGTYISLDAGEMLSTIMVDDAPDLVRFSDGLSALIEAAAKAAKKEDPRIALFWECCGLLCEEGNKNAAIRLETVGNDLIQTHNVDILCAYPLNVFHDSEKDYVFMRLCAAHSAFRSA